MSKIVIQQLDDGARNCHSHLLKSQIATDPTISAAQTVPLATELTRHPVGPPPSSGDNCRAKGWGFGNYDKIIFPGSLTNATATVCPNSEQNHLAVGPPPSSGDNCRAKSWGFGNYDKIIFPGSLTSDQTTVANATATFRPNSEQNHLASCFAPQSTLVGDWTAFPQVLNPGRVISYPGSIPTPSPSLVENSTQCPAPRSTADPASGLNLFAAHPARKFTTQPTVSPSSLPSSSAAFSNLTSSTWALPHRAPASIDWLRNFLTPLDGEMSPHSLPSAYLHLTTPFGASLGVAGIGFRGSPDEGLDSLFRCLPTKQGVGLTDLVEDMKQAFLCLSSADRYTIANGILEPQRTAPTGELSFEQETAACLSAISDGARVCPLLLGKTLDRLAIQGKLHPWDVFLFEIDTTRHQHAILRVMWTHPSEIGRAHV